MHRVDWTRDAKKDRDIAIKNGLRAEVAEALEIVRQNPRDPNPPKHHYEELKGKLKGIHTRRLDYANRLAYQILPNSENDKDPKTGEIYDGIVKVISMWGHFPEKPAHGHA
jgi:Txe/YoeB family toxin of Txe-Axe toxin-antitoxin module